MKPLRIQLIQQMQLKGYSQSTIKTYIDSILVLAKYYNTSPNLLTIEQIRDYILYCLTEKKLSKSWMNQIISALKILFRDIFRLYGGQYLEKHKHQIQHLKTMFAIQHCRTSVLGEHIDKCDHCGHNRITYNSCRNRHCPKCQGLERTKWVDKLAGNLLPVSYFHVVFTIPSELNRLALVNQECLYNILFKAASETLIILSRDKKHLGAYTGFVAVLHTWSQNLMEHPHLHLMVPAGGWDEVAQYWKHSRKKFFISVKVISEVFRGKFLSLLKEANKEKQLKFEGEIKPLILKSNFKQLLDILYNKDWVVFCGKSFRNSSQIIKYLGRYTHRVAISNSRILGIENDEVIFRWKDYRDKGKQKIMKLPAQEFIRRFLLHVLPKGFCKIRYYGIFASRNRRTIMLSCKNAFWKMVPKSKYIGLKWHEIMFLITGVNPFMCPVCRKGNMLSYIVNKGKRAPP